MENEKTFTSFGAFGAAKKEEEKTQLQRLFDETLRDRLEQVPQGNYKSELPPIASISFSRPLGEHAKSMLYADLFYASEKGAERHITWTITNNGVMMGQTPRELRTLSHESIEREILRIVQSIDLTFWHPADIKIIPEQDPTGEKVEAGETRESMKRIIDSERLKFVEGQPGALFGFYEKQKGFSGYRVVVFPWGFVLENEQVGNAAFVAKLHDSIPIELEVLEKPPASRVDDAARDAIIATHIAPLLEQAKTRNDLVVNLGARRVVHNPKSWRESLGRAMQEYSKK